MNRIQDPGAAADVASQSDWDKNRRLPTTVGARVNQPVAVPVQSNPDIARVKRNIKRMLDQNAPEADIDAYVASEGVTLQQLQAHQPSRDGKVFLNINGRRVSVDSQFLNLSQSEQQATVAEIARQHEAMLEAEKRKAIAIAESSIDGKSYSGTSTPQQHSWDELPGNILPSAGRMAERLWQTVRHPVQTVETLADATAGGLNRLMPDWSQEARRRNLGNEAYQREQQISGAVGQMFHDRYGSMDAIRETAITDPVGLLGDTSAILSAGGTLAARVPMTAGTVANALKTAGNISNPISLAGKVAGPVMRGTGRSLAYPLAMTTGAAPQAIQEAARSGMAGGEVATAFRNSMRGAEGGDTVVNEAKTALANMAESRRAQYMQNMAGTAASQATVDTAPIHAAYKKVWDSLHVTPPPSAPMAGLLTEGPAPVTGLLSNSAAYAPLSKATPGELVRLKEIKALLAAWENHPHGKSPIALDALKQRINKMMPSPTAENAANERRIVTAMANAVKDAIVKTVPDYGKAMGEYEKSIGLKQELEKSLSLTGRSSTDTALSKLQSALKNQKRMGHVKELEQHGAPNILPRIAGQQLADAMPKGAAKVLAGLIAGGATYSNPMLLPSLVATSPRAVGELAHVIGRGARNAGKLDARGLLAAIMAGHAGETAQQ